MTNPSRRNIVNSAAWSLPVIAAAVAAPAASASLPPAKEALSCHKIRHGGPGGHQWVGMYSDGSTVTMTNGDAMSGEFGELCRASGSNPGAGQ